MKLTFRKTIFVDHLQILQDRNKWRTWATKYCQISVFK